MIDNIQKLYEIAGVDSVGFNTYTLKDEYPPFTAEKQLELIKLMGSYLFNNFHCYVVSARWSVDYGKWAVGVGGCDVCHEQFEQALAGLVLEMWDGIPVDQKQEIKRIL